MEILSCVEVECAAAGTVEPDVQHTGCGNNIISAHYSISEESSDEDALDCNVHVEGEDNSCCVCGKHIPFLDHLMEHLKTHRDMVCCHLCKADFNCAVSLAIHLKYSHPKYQPCCNVCRVPFRGTWHLNEHLEKHQRKLTALKKVKKVKRVKVKPFVKKKATGNIVKQSIISNSWHDHSYCAPVELKLSTVVSEIQKGDKNCPITMSQDVKNVLIKEEQTDMSSSCLMMEHLKTHRDMVCCHLCKAYFSSAASLAIHLKYSHPKYQPCCKVCRVHFRGSWHLEKHQRKVTALKKVKRVKVKPFVKKKATENKCKQSIISNSWHDHSYFAPVDLKLSTVASEIQTGDKNCPITMSQDVKNVIIKEEQTDIPSSCPLYLSGPPYEEEYEIPGGNESSDSAEEDNLPPGDTEYLPDEDLSSDSQCSAGYNTDELKRSSRSHHQKTQRSEVSGSEKKTSFANHSVNAVESRGEKNDFQTDSPKSTSVKMEMNVNTCEKKPTFVCCMCKAVCENKKSLLKHIAEKHPTAVYICACCLNSFSKQDAFKNHICWNRRTGQMNVLLATTVPQVPVVNLSHGDGQRTSPAPVLGPKPVEIKMIPVTQSLTPAVAPLKTTVSEKMTLVPSLVSVASQTVKTFPQTTVPTQAKLVGNISPLGPAKLTDLKPQAVTEPQTIVRPHCPPNAPNVCLPSIQRPSLPNQTRMTLRIPTPFNPSLQTQKNSVFVSFSPTVNFSAPILVSANSNKFIPAPRQTIATNIRPIQLAGNANIRSFQLAGNMGPLPLPGNIRHLHFHAGNVRPLQLHGTVRPILLPGNVRAIHLSGNAPVPSASCPILVSSILQKNQPQVSPHISPVQVQVPTPGPLKIVAMFENKSNNSVLQKQLKQTWRSKTIFPCRHCGAISRQPSLRVRHRYLHRGSRLYRCQCGRSFQRLIHLLRHQVQHAESVRFLCACCGRTFEGAHKLSRHKQESWLKHGQYAKTKCTKAFDCICGQAFARPSALLWHMLKNTKHTLSYTKTQWIK